MAEYCKECFKNKILTAQERREIADEQLIVSPEKDLCEGCGELKYIVDFVLSEDMDDDMNAGCKILTYFTSRG